jgi:hypothetical protein
MNSPRSLLRGEFIYIAMIGLMTKRLALAKL